MDELVSELPNKLDTEISSSEDLFSPGQKILLSLARAILRQPKVLKKNKKNFIIFVFIVFIVFI